MKGYISSKITSRVVCTIINRLNHYSMSICHPAYRCMVYGMVRIDATQHHSHLVRSIPNANTSRV